MMDPKVLASAFAHAQEASPREACGLVVIHKGRQTYFPCRNIGPMDQFEIHPEDWAAAEDDGEIVRVIHSHPNVPVHPTDADRLGCERSGLPWTILQVPGMVSVDLVPNGWEPPLVGRAFAYGILDCFTLVRDYYRQEHGIHIPDWPRVEGWDRQGGNHFLDHYEEAGFQRIDFASLRPGDVILFQMNGSPVPNHAGIYLGDQVLHHAQGRLSSRDVFGGYYRRCAVLFLRHRDMA